MKIENTGYCALTGEFGRFAKSHIIPKAFVRRVTELKFVLEDERGFLRRELDACRDDNLLTAKGEKITAAYDGAAISLLRKGRLTYATRRNAETLEIEDTGLIPYRIIELQTMRIADIKLFGLSLLWRAAASKRDEFSNINLDPHDQEKLRIAVATGDPGSVDFFPCFFSVFDHGTELVKMNPTLIELEGIEFYRFFLDGVLCYISKRMCIPGGYDLGRWNVGADNNLVVLTLPSVDSAQDRIGQAGILRLFEKFGDPWENARGAEKIKRLAQQDTSTNAEAVAQDKK